MSAANVESLRRKNLRLSYIEGSLWAFMVAAGDHLSLFYAVKRGLTPLQVAIITTVPWFIGSLANATLPGLFSRAHLRSALIFWFCVQIFGLGLLAFSVSQESHFEWALAGLIFYWLGGQSATPLWMDWISGWLPQARFGRFYSRRSGALSIVILIAYVGMGAAVQQTTNLGIYYWIFGFAALARFFSVIVLSVQSSPPERKSDLSSGHSLSVKSASLKIVWSIIIASSIFKLVANITSPFILPYMITELQFSTIEVTLVNAVAFLGLAVLMASFGEALKKFNPVVGLQISMWMAAINCVVWYFVEGPISAGIVQFFSGLGWGTFDLACVLIIQSHFPRGARKYLGLQLSLTYLGVIVGGVIGSQLLENGVSIVNVIGISSLLRLGACLAFGVWVLNSNALKHPVGHYYRFVREAFLARIGRSSSTGA